MTKDQHKLPKDWEPPMRALAATLREHNVKVAWNGRLARALMLWGLKHLLFNKATHRAEPQDPLIVTDGCMWEANKVNGTRHSHAIEVVNERTGAVRFIKSGSRIAFVSGDMSDARTQEAYNAQRAKIKP